MFDPSWNSAMHQISMAEAAMRDRAKRANELTDAGRDYCNALVREHHDRLMAAGIRVDEGFHNMLFNAFSAGAKFATDEVDDLREKLALARKEYDGAYREWSAYVNRLTATSPGMTPETRAIIDRIDVDAIIAKVKKIID